MDKPIRIWHVAKVCDIPSRELRDFLQGIFSFHDYPTSSSRIDPTMAVALVATFNPEALNALSSLRD